MEYVAKAHRKGVIRWLFTGMFLVFVMILIGGITRLTESGLSITEWKVVTGSVPPLTQEKWEEEFQKYQQSPEFIHKNFDFTLQDFKGIYWWEWIHRQIGRIIGVVFIIPFLYFYSKKAFTAKAQKRLLFILILGGFQGFLGWYMVSSGLQYEPRVSHFRLAMHLCAALLTISLIWWLILDIKSEEKAFYKPSKLTESYKKLIYVFFAFLAIQIVYGAFVAGLDAGLFYNTWPKMGDEWVATGVFGGKPLYENLYQSNAISTIQFMHRTIAIVVASLVFALWWSARKLNLNKQENNLVTAMLIMVCVQFLLGIFTLLYGVPIWLGVAHQIGAVILLLISLNYAFVLLQGKKS